MQTFMLSSNKKNEQQTTFHKKVTSKRRGKNQSFDAFTHTRLFSVVHNFFGGLFLQFFKSFALCIKFSMIRYPILIFSTTYFGVLLVLFGNFKDKKGRNG